MKIFYNIYIEIYLLTIMYLLLLLLYFVYQTPPYNKVNGVGMEGIKKSQLISFVVLCLPNSTLLQSVWSGVGGCKRTIFSDLKKIVWLIKNQVKVTMHKKGSLYDICIVNLEQL